MYLTTKSTHIVDSSGFLDGKSKLEAGDIKDLTERFAKRWDAGFKPKLGQTTHTRGRAREARPSFGPAPRA